MVLWQRMKFMPHLLLVLEGNFPLILKRIFTKRRENMKKIKRKTFIISQEAHDKLFKLFVVNKGKKSYSRIINEAITAYYTGKKMDSAKNKKLLDLTK